MAINLLDYVHDERNALRKILTNRMRIEALARLRRVAEYLDVPIAKPGEFALGVYVGDGYTEEYAIFDIIEAIVKRLERIEAILLAIAQEDGMNKYSTQ